MARNEGIANQRRNLLKEPPCLFQRLCPNDTVLIKAPRGRTIFLRDQNVAFIQHLHKGVVGVINTTKDGHEILSALILPDQFIGVAGFVRMYDSRLTIHLAEARALTPVTYCRIRREAVWGLMEDRSARSTIVDSMCKMIYNMSSMTSNPLKHDVETRILCVLEVLARGIGERTRDGWISIAGITHADIATMANTTRPTANRILNKLQKDGVIEIRRRVMDISIAKSKSLFENT
ncbi:MAG: Crp/Fnr family transcriptional regulator [Chloroflexi bacterium]|nr:Crp/Fnr family transcriptional regulator [Chloroflexota bacterium]